MKKQYFKIAAVVVFTLSVFTGAAQNDEKPVLERYSSSTAQKNKEESNVVPELKKSSVNTANNRNGSESSEQLVAPQLKRADSQPTTNEQPKKSN